MFECVFLESFKDQSCSYFAYSPQICSRIVLSILFKIVNVWLRPSYVQKKVTQSALNVPCENYGFAKFLVILETQTTTSKIRTCCWYLIKSGGSSKTREKELSQMAGIDALRASGQSVF